MRFKQFLLEMPTLNSISTREDSEFRELLNSNRYAFRSPNKVIEYNNLFLGLYTSRKELEIVAYKSKNINNGNAIAMCGGNFTNKFNFLSIDYSETLDSYKNKGIMSSIYTYIIETYGGIISDDSISVGISKIYEKLIKKFYSYSIDMFHKNLKPIKTLEMEKSKLIVLSKEELDIKEWDSIEESYFQQLLEMPQYKKETIPDKKEMESVLKDRYDFFKNNKVIDSFKYDGFLFELIQGNSALWFIIKDGVAVGFSGFRGLDDDVYNFVQVGSLYVTKEYRNKGLATKLYEYMIEKYGGIISDYELSKNSEFGSYYIYEKLLKKYFGYEKYYQNIKKIKTLSDKTNRHSNIIISKKEIKENIEESYFQQLLEMPKINSNKMTPSTSFKREDGKTIVKKDGIELIETSEQNYSLQFTIDDKIVGIMTIQEDDNIKGFVFISYVKVHSSYRGKGIASKMYDFAINHFGGIVSGMSLTKDEETKQGSFYVWKSLSKKYNMYSLENEVLSKLGDIEDEKYKKTEVMFVASKKKLTKKDVWGHVTLKEYE